MRSYKQMYDELWSKRQLDTFPGTYERNKVLLSFFKKTLGKVLDLGCGDGAISEYLRGRGSDVLSLDISCAALLKAKYERKLDNCILANAEQIPVKNETFDTVFWGDNIEHLFFPMKALNEIHRVLKREGKVIISFPNSSWLMYRLSYLIRGKVPSCGATETKPWEWTHIRSFNRHIISEMLEISGFALDRVASVGAGNWNKLANKLARKVDLFAAFLIVEARKARY